VRALIDAGADINHTDEYGRTPLQRAESLNKFDMVELMTKNSVVTTEQEQTTEIQQELNSSQITESSDDAEIIEDDTATAMVTAGAETGIDALQTDLDQNPFLKRYQLGLTVVELVAGFATLELTSASDTLIQQVRSGIDLLSVDISNLDSDEDRLAVTAMRKAIDSITQTNNLQAVLLVAPSKTDEEFVRIAEDETRVAEEVEASNQKDLIRQIQIELTNLGYDPGPADGIAGAGTIKVIKEYQDAAGINIDGIPSDTLLAHLQSTEAVPRQVIVAEPEKTSKFNEFIDNLLKAEGSSSKDEIGK